MRIKQLNDHLFFSYDDCLEDLLSMDSEYSEIVIATHNENSVRLAAKLLQTRPPGVRSNVSFAQLYGMANYMSFTLGKSILIAYNRVSTSGRPM